MTQKNFNAVNDFHYDCELDLTDFWNWDYTAKITIRKLAVDKLQ